MPAVQLEAARSILALAMTSPAATPASTPRSPHGVPPGHKRRHSYARAGIVSTTCARSCTVRMIRGRRCRSRAHPWVAPPQLVVFSTEIFTRAQKQPYFGSTNKKGRREMPEAAQGLICGEARSATLTSPPRPRTRPPGSSTRAGGSSPVLRSGNKDPTSRRPSPDPLRSLRLCMVSEPSLGSAGEYWAKVLLLACYCTVLTGAIHVRFPLKSVNPIARVS